MAIGLTALAFVLEKKEGLYERNLVSGKYNFFVFNGKLLHAYVSVCVFWRWVWGERIQRKR